MISVIVPVYKTEAYLDRCVKSVLSQKNADFELILVDDGSPDRCGELCDGYAAADARVKVIHQENQGVSVARNVGMDAAKGDYLAFVDSDDEMLDGALEFFAGLTERAPGLPLYVAAAQEQSGRLLTDFSLPVGPHSAGDFFTHAAVDDTLRSVHAKLFSRAFLVQNGLRFDPAHDFAEDALFMLDVLALRPALRLDDRRTYLYRLKRPGSVCTAFYSSDSDDAAFVSRCNRSNRLYYERYARLWETLAPADADRAQLRLFGLSFRLDEYLDSHFHRRITTRAERLAMARALCDCAQLRDFAAHDSPKRLSTTPRILFTLLRGGHWRLCDFAAALRARLKPRLSQKTTKGATDA